MANSKSSKKAAAEKRAEEQRRKQRLYIAITIIALLIFAGLWLYNNFYNGGDTPPYVYGEGDAAVHFLDVGQGDSAIIQLPDGKNMIIDAGTAAQASKVKSYMAELSITHFDVVLLTHTDADHSGGFGGQGASPSGALTVSGLTVGKVYMPRIKSDSTLDPLTGNTKAITTASYRNFVTAVKNSGAEIVYTQAAGNADNGVIAEGAGYEIRIYAPMNESVYDNVGDNSSAGDKNKVSPIIILEYNERRVMFTGDATGATETEFLTSTQLLDVRVDVLKVAHHGSGTEGSNSQAFYNAVRPAFSVISVKEGIYNNVPATEVINRIQSVNGFQKLFRTDKDGDIVCTLTEGGEIKWWTSKDGSITLAVVNAEDFAAVYVWSRERGAFGFGTADGGGNV